MESPFLPFYDARFVAASERGGGGEGRLTIEERNLPNSKAKVLHTPRQYSGFQCEFFASRSAFVNLSWETRYRHSLLSDDGGRGGRRRRQRERVFVGWLVLRRRMRLGEKEEGGGDGGDGGDGNKKDGRGSFTSGSLPHHNSKEAPRQTFSRMESHSKEKRGRI